MKKIVLTFLCFAAFSCNFMSDEVKKTAKSRAATDRINSSQENNNDVFKDLD